MKAKGKDGILLPASTRVLPKIEPVGRKQKPFDDFYHLVLTLSWWRFFLFFSIAYVLANVLFALLFLASPGSIANARPGSLVDSFFFSIQTMATIGYGEKYPANFVGNLLVTLESLVSILGTAIVTGLTFAKFARPTARVLFSKNMVVGPRNGVPTLMFRMANWRHNQIFEAKIRLIILITETTLEGETLRRPHDLVLLRSHTAVFGLTWMAMHIIDEHSPFFGEGALEKLRQQRAEIFLSLTGVDETFSQTVHARHMYVLDDILWGARFADVLMPYEPGQTRRIDYSNFHTAIPLEPR
jgi:inward rectifier potassium channel